MTAVQGGLFITFEGGDGAGKTTQLDLARQYLESLGRPVFRTREPGGTPMGVQVREILLKSSGPIDPRAEALLFAADRAQHINTLVQPNLNRGLDVLQDRYFDSSVAYQGAGRALDGDQVRDISIWAANGLLPDLTILLDIDPKVAAGRVTHRGQADRIEAEADEFRVRLREEFLAISRAEPERVKVVDANLSVAEVAADIRNLLNRLVMRQ